MLQFERYILSQPVDRTAQEAPETWTKRFHIWLTTTQQGDK